MCHRRPELAAAARGSPGIGGDERMRRGRADFSINHRLLGGFGIAAVIFVALAIVAETRLARISELRRIQHDELLPRVVLTEELESASVQMGIEARHFALTRDERSRKVFEDASSRFLAAADRLVPLLTPESPPVLRDIRALGEAYDRAARELIDLGNASSADDYLRADVWMLGAREAAFVPIREYLAEQRARAARMQDQIGNAVAEMRHAGLFLGLLTLGAMTFAAVWTIRQVRGPLKALVAEVRRVTRHAVGDDGAVPASRIASRRRDEVQELSDAFAAMERAVRQRATALRDSEERFRSVFERAAVGVGLLGPDGRFLEVNDRYAEIVGYTRREMEQLAFLTITHPDDAPASSRLMSRLLAGEIPAYNLVKRYLRKDGGIAWVSLSVGLAHDDAGRPAYCAVVAEDVTDRKRAEEALRASEERLRVANDQLREADRRKNDFMGMLSHELRNPLAPIRNSLFILDHVAPTGEQARRAREVATRQVAHVTRLVDDLLDITRVARGKIELRRTDLDLNAVAGRTADDFRALLSDRGLDLEVNLPAEAVVVNGDETRLAQVFGNLLSNAAKFTPAGGRVALSVRAQGDRGVVRVRDTGPGIDPEVLPTIFEPFTQGKQTLARSEGGLGLGLSLVKGLVALHGGEVTAFSGGGEGGTDFVVTLPLAHRAGEGPEAPAPGRSRRPAATARRVLVIDDNRDAADTLAQVVEMLGHTPVVAYDAVAGLARAAENVPDVVLCDIGLPGIDGYEFARRFRTRAGSRDVRLVAVSGYAQPEDVARAVEAGFDAHVAKPADPSRLEEALAA
jgi:PAS domain S-box-containing protein